MGNAYELYQEDSTGSIQLGKYADFIVLNQNLLDIPVRNIHETKVLKTVLAGEIVFQRTQP